jgi:predicted transcriptional regulator
MKLDMKLNINKEQLKGFGKMGLKIGKQIVLDGAKALAVKGAKVAIETVFAGQSIKSVKLDDVLSGTRSHVNQNLIFLDNEEVINPSTGDVYRKVSPFEQEIRAGLRNETDQE